MQLVFLQTSDADAYAEMMASSSRTVRAFCRRTGFAYESYIGIKRGYWNWQTTFNRFYLLAEQLERGRYDWAVYLDADAYIADLGFDFRAYLEPHAERAGILASSGASIAPWDINAGVLLLNLRHPIAAALIEDGKARYDAVPDEMLRESREWFNPNDQDMIHDFLRDREGALECFHFEDRGLINSMEARFIRQLTRAEAHDIPTRIQLLKEEAERVLAGSGEEARSREDAYGEPLVNGCYRMILGRDPDPHGFGHFMHKIGALGVAAGAQYMILQMVNSDEYRARLGLLRPEPEPEPQPEAPTEAAAEVV